MREVGVLVGVKDAPHGRHGAAGTTRSSPNSTIERGDCRTTRWHTTQGQAAGHSTRAGQAGVAAADGVQRAREP